MRKIICLTSLLLLYGASAMAGFENHPNLSQLNTFTQSMIQTITQNQADFFIEHGEYFHGPWVLGDDAIVDGTTEESADCTTKASNIDYSYRDLNPAIFKNNLKVPCNFVIEAYISPTGHGWRIKVELYMEGLGPDAYGVEGDRWVFQHNFGPEQDASQIWDEWFVLLPY